MLLYTCGNNKVFTGHQRPVHSTASSRSQDGSVSAGAAERLDAWPVVSLYCALLPSLVLYQFIYISGIYLYLYILIYVYLEYIWLPLPVATVVKQALAYLMVR